jgi:transglutaminase-like putative cysteine protease
MLLTSQRIGPAHFAGCLFALSLVLTCATGDPQPCASQAKNPEPATNPQSGYTIELLETRVRFEPDGTGSKDIHVAVRLHSESGARQFSELAFGYDRAFEQLEIPTLHVQHASGGSMEILPRAIGDRAAPAAADTPAYQDVREKFVHVAGLEPGDRLEYRVVTTLVHPPFAPDFFFSHSFGEENNAAKESLELDLPAGRQVTLRTAPGLPAPVTVSSGAGSDARTVYRWSLSEPQKLPNENEQGEVGRTTPDVTLSTFPSWEEVSQRLALSLAPQAKAVPEIEAKAKALTAGAAEPLARLQAIYDFVAQKVRTVDLPLGAAGFRAHQPREILASGYATPEDKFVLLAALAQAAGIRAQAALCSAARQWSAEAPVPSAFDHLVIRTRLGPLSIWFDPSLEVAPFGAISANLRGKRALIVQDNAAPPDNGSLWATIPRDLPFPATQDVTVSGALDATGKLSGRARYSLRGDNELLLRLTFHRALPDQWKGLAQLLAVSDGFRGQVSEAKIRDPLETHRPFRVEYTVTEPHLVNWAKLPARLKVPLPTLGLPELPAKAGAPVDLGTPLDIHLHLRLQLPADAAVLVPVGISVRREYAEYESSYSIQNKIVLASRHLKFLEREVAAGDAADYAAFTRAVQNDEAQELTLERTPP